MSKEMNNQPEKLLTNELFTGAENRVLESMEETTMINRHVNVITSLMASLCIALVPSAFAFDSGSTGADGALNPTVDTQLALPADGVFNFTTVNIPSGVTLSFTKNVTNTPVVLLASGDVTVAGTVDLRGTNGADVGAAGDGNIGDDGIPGVGGPGGFDGGRGGSPTPGFEQGGYGLGPGGGLSSINFRSGRPCGGGGGSHANNGVSPSATSCAPSIPSYGVETLLPLIGGSGGGGGRALTSFGGSGGGGGGGAILIASSGTVSITGSINASGRASGNVSGADSGADGGGGAGGAIRVVATTISGNGTIVAGGGGTGVSNHNVAVGTNGSVGRIRLEAENMLRTAGTSPAFTFASPGDVFVAGMPTITISSVAGVAAPASPTGTADIILPETTPNPVTVNFTTANVPLGNTISLSVVPANGDPTTTLTSAITGSEPAGSASGNIDIPDGPSVLQASVSYTVTAMLGDFFSRFADGERVQEVEVKATLNGGSDTVFTTVSGKKFTWPSNAIAMK